MKIPAARCATGAGSRLLPLQSGDKTHPSADQRLAEIPVLVISGLEDDADSVACAWPNLMIYAKWTGGSTVSHLWSFSACVPKVG